MTNVVLFLNDTATTEIYTYGHTLSLHAALPISLPHRFDLASHRKSVLAGRGPGRVGEGLRGKAVFTIRSACRAIHWDYHHFSENVQSEARRPDALLPPCLCPDGLCGHGRSMRPRSEEHTSELQSLIRISYAVF